MTGRLLAQVRGGAATTSLAGGGSSLSSRWKSTSNGDGSYRIANASTGGLLGVDATSDAGRAWGAKPTVTAAPAGGPTVGQQWFVVPSTTMRGAATGTYRPVNRYSGLVLGLSGNPTRPAEITPTRAWTDTKEGPVGGGRTAPEQTLTLAPYKVFRGQ
ncbi:RICIN domain-containing protein [Streptomyces sp. NPDC088788]|uniref:RICIN domain-containing protein n=1 Tax=Streptomyces sp. NPDC088788 TaxID=3365898 RepID=UPI003817140A